MTPQERQMLGDLFERVKATGATPRDAEAEAFINDAVHTAPFSPYVLAQTVLVQQQALEAAARRISEVEAAQRQSADQGQEHGSFLGNLGKSIFGGAPASPPAPPRPSYDASAYQRGPAPAPGQGYAPPPQQGYPAPPQGYPPQPGPWGAPPQSGGGGGFLQNAASTAAGVAGGVALGNILGGLFSGHSGGGGLFGGGGASGAGLLGDGARAPEVNETVNNYYESPSDRGNADYQQSDSNAPGVEDASFDRQDDSNFDNSDGSSFDDGGGYDDV
jgi:hypothetical protein